MASAEFLVGELSRAGIAAMTLGDRDMALGRSQLEKLHAKAGFPWLVSNLFDAGSDKLVFDGHKVVQVGGVRVGLFGLLSPVSAGRVIKNLEDDQGWRFVAPAVAAQRAVKALKGAGAEFIVVLSHLSAREEAEVASAVPDVRLFLGGQSAGRRTEASRVGDGFSVLAGEKGKALAITTLTLSSAAGPGAPLSDPGRKASIERRLARAKTRLSSLEKRLAEAKDGPPRSGTGFAGSPGPHRSNRPKALQRQIAALRAEAQILELDLEEVAAPDPTDNQVRFERINLGRGVADDASVAARVEAFRKVWPDPKKARKRASSKP